LNPLLFTAVSHQLLGVNVLVLKPHPHNKCINNNNNNDNNNNKVLTDITGDAESPFHQCSLLCGPSAAHHLTMSSFRFFRHLSED
jgi:hypothetical protein